MDKNNLEQIYQQLVKGLQNYFAQSGYDKAVIGVSGGVDSALTLKLAVDALGGNKVTGISMPEIGVSAQINVDHARRLCEALEVTFYSQPINQLLADFTRLPWKTNQLALCNAKARIRAVLLYNYANSNDALVLGTSNKSEILLGYGTKYGDLAADLEVIGDLFKDQVFALADYVGLPPEIINKEPTAELFTGQTDERELGAKYSDLDPILKKIDLNKPDLGEAKIIEKGLNPILVHSVLRRIRANRHKSEMPPALKVGKEEKKLERKNDARISHKSSSDHNPQTTLESEPQEPEVPENQISLI